MGACWCPVIAVTIREEAGLETPIIPAGRYRLWEKKLEIIPVILVCRPTYVLLIFGYTILSGEKFEIGAR
jgi:hypothetical protein